MGKYCNMDSIERFKEISSELASLYEMKNSDYGDSFSVTFRELGIISAVTRMNDKMNRLKSLCVKDIRVKDESIRDTLTDLACYSIMTIMELDKMQNDENR